MRAAIYVRCSTVTKKKLGDVSAYPQDPEAQVKPLLELPESRGWELYRVNSDRTSGAKEARRGLNALMEDARRRRFGVVLVWRFDRFARSVRQLVLALEEFDVLGIEFIRYQEALDTSTPTGKAMFTIIAAMAELERSVIREQVVNLRARGTSLRSIARDLGAPDRRRSSRFD
jgi:DNA invertase Pin-like site-specific DNA recombinase